MAQLRTALGQDLRDVPFEGGAIGAIEQIFGAKQQVPAQEPTRLRSGEATGSAAEFRAPPTARPVTARLQPVGERTYYEQVEVIIRFLMGRDQLTPLEQRQRHG